MFPIAYEREEETNKIINMRLIKNPKNIRNFEIDVNEHDDRPVHSYFIHNKDFKDNIDSYV